MSTSITSSSQPSLIIQRPSPGGGPRQSLLQMRSQEKENTLRTLLNHLNNRCEVVKNKTNVLPLPQGEQDHV